MIQDYRSDFTEHLQVVEKDMEKIRRNEVKFLVSLTLPLCLCLYVLVLSVAEQNDMGFYFNLQISVQQLAKLLGSQREVTEKRYVPCCRLASCAT